MTKLIYQEPLPASLARNGIHPGNVSLADDGSLHFSVHGCPTWKPVVDFLPEHVRPLIAALVEHLGLKIADPDEQKLLEQIRKIGNDRFQEALEIARSECALFDNAVTPESLGIVDGKLPPVDREPSPFWRNTPTKDDTDAIERYEERVKLARTLHEASDGRHDIRYALYKIASAIESGAL
jgi:hypothetical protein